MNRQEYIRNFKEKNKRLPTKEEIATALKISERTAMHELAQYLSTVKEVKQQATVKNAKENRSVVLIRIAMFTLSAMAFTLSVYFTGLWFIGRFNLFISGMISLTMVLFMVVAPQTLRFVSNPVVKFIVSVSFLIAIVFSMGSTIAGQYQKSTLVMESAIDKSYVFNQLASNEDEVKQLISDAQKDKAIHQQTLEQLSATKEDRLSNWQQIATERKYIESFDSRIDSLRAELKDTREKVIDNGTVEEKRDFYFFISGITGIKKSMVEFIISSLPSVFIDIVSALCLNLALFIKDEKR